MAEELIEIEHKALYDHLPQGYHEIPVEDLAERWQRIVEEEYGRELQAIEIEWVDRHMENTERLLNRAGYSMSDRCLEAERNRLREIAADQLAV